MWDDFLNRIETEFNSDKKTFLQKPLIKKTIACVANELCDSISSQIGTEHFIKPLSFKAL